MSINVELLKRNFDAEAYVLGKLASPKITHKRVDGVCPFHEAKNDSNNFPYYRETKTWTCWAGCGGGDILEFMGREGIGFIDACKAMGYTGDGVYTPPSSISQIVPKKPTVGKIRSQPPLWNDTAKKYKEYCVTKLWGEYSHKLDYLIGRGLTYESIRKYGIGYCPKWFLRPAKRWGLEAEFAEPVKIGKGYTIPWDYGGCVTTAVLCNLYNKLALFWAFGQTGFRIG